MARADIADDVQFLAAVASCLVVHHFACSLAGLRGGGLALTFGNLASLQFRRAARFFLGGALAVLLIAAAFAFFLLPFPVLALLLQSICLGLLDGGLGLLLG